MVEAMFERSPKYFKQFQKQFKFLFVEEKPGFAIGNFHAMCPHFDSEFCNLVKALSTFWLTTFENDTLKWYQSFPVPCVYTDLKFLFWTASILKTNGDVFLKPIWHSISTFPRQKPIHSQCAKDCQFSLITSFFSKSSSTKQTNVNTKQSAKMPVLAQKLSTMRSIYQNKFKLILLIVKLYEDLKQFCMVLILMLFAK